METTARSLKIELQQFPVRALNEFEDAFDRMVQRHMEAVEISDDGMLNVNFEAIAALSSKRRLLSIGNTGIAQAGGLMGYGVDFVARYRRAAVFVDKILKGTKPADIPVEQATKFELAVNRKTANALGLTIPETLLATADEVIQ